MREFKTDDLDLCAAIVTVTGQHPGVNINTNRATFTFTETPEVFRVVLDFAAGNLICNARCLLRTRRNLFNRIRGGGR